MVRPVRWIVVILAFFFIVEVAITGGVMRGDVACRRGQDCRGQDSRWRECDDRDCRGLNPAYGGQEVMMANQEGIENVLSKHTDELMSLPGVVGVGQGVCDGGLPCIKVFVVERTPEIERNIPKQIDQFPLDIEATGEFRPLAGRRSDDRS